jgi:DNA-binding MarR family transcriptional regulator
VSADRVSADRVSADRVGPDRVGPDRASPDRKGAQSPTLLYLVKQLELRVRSHLDELVRPAGLTALQYTALTVLEGHPDLTSARLARRSFVTAQSMADMVKALLARQLIERHPDAADRRRLLLALTPQGRELLSRYRRPVADLETRMLSELTTAQATQLRRAILSCHHALSD